MSKRYSVKVRSEIIRESTRLNDNKYGAWRCVNRGTGLVTVMNVELQPGEGLDFSSDLQPGDIWSEPIDIIVQAGGELVLLRNIYTPLS